MFASDRFPELSGEIFTTLRPDAQGNLWMRNEHNGIVMGQNGRFRKLGEADGLPARGASALAAANGKIWIGDEDGRLLKYDQGHFVVVKDKPPSPDWGRLSNLQVDVNGIAWTWSREQCARLIDGEWAIVPGVRGGILALRALRNGGGAMLTLMQPGRLVLFANGKLSDLDLVPGGIFNFLLSEDPAGDWWLANETGVLCRASTGGWSVMTQKDGFPNDSLASELVDREGNHWFGTDGGGLVRIKRRAVKSLGVADGMSKKVALSLAVDGSNSVWVASLGGGLVHFDGARFTTNHDPQRMAWCVRNARNGGLWVGTYGAGLFWWDKQAGAPWERIDSDSHPGFMGEPVDALFEASTGDLWIGGLRGGVSRYSSGKFRSWTTTNGLRYNRVNAIEEDRSGVIWIGTDGGLSQIKGENITSLAAAEGLAGKPVQSLFRDSAGVLWIGGRELTRCKDGKFAAIRATNGLPIPFIKAMIEDDLGNLWLSTPQGILRASLRQLNEFCDSGKGQVEFLVFTRSDGLPSNECSGYEPAAAKGADGRLWFPTMDGVAVIDPLRLPENKVPPPVVIEAVVADGNSMELPAGQAVAGAESAKVRIPAGTLRLEFRFAALSFTAPEKNRFRYRLESFDSDWVQAGTSQIAWYTRPPPGNYRFHVSACNSAGVWNEAGGSLELLVLPEYWQTWWFRAALALAVGGAVFSGFYYRIAQLKRAHAAQAEFSRQLINAEEAERKRMAGELHDSLGQELLLIKNRAVLGLACSDPSPAMAEQLRRISESAGNAIEEIRATAFALRPYELDRLGLTRAAESMIRKVAVACGIRFSMDLDEVQGLLPPEVEISLYRILQEAINNIVKHSKAASVIVELKREPPILRLDLLDDGRGFDAAAMKEEGSSGFGLKGIAQRCSLIGGSFQILSASGKGTRLTITVPLPKPKA